MYIYDFEKIKKKFFLKCLKKFVSVPLTILGEKSSSQNQKISSKTKIYTRIMKNAGLENIKICLVYL